MKAAIKVFTSFLTLSLIMVATICVATAAETITDIKISGNRRIEAAAIRAKISSAVGKPYSPDKIEEDIKSIYKIGYFQKISVDLDDGTLTYIVEEKPILSKVIFEGNDAIGETKLREILKTKPFTVFDVAKINDDRQAIIKAYEEKGYYLAEVSYELKDVSKENDATLIFKIHEGEKVQVKQITFLGNKKIPDSILKRIIQTREHGPLSFITSFGNYQQAVLDRDVQILNYYYYTQGYVQVRVATPNVYVTPDKLWIYITLNIEEGEQFNIGTIDIGGDMLFPKEELMGLLQMKEGDLFNNEVVNREVMRIATKYKDQGYAFANVIPMTTVREGEKKVDLFLNIEQGEKVYIGEINFVDNTKTRDKVLRREVIIKEGELYNETKVQTSLANIKRLGFFANVTLNKPQGEKQNIVDLEIVVEEKSTGTLNVGAGFSSADGFVITAAVSEQNFLGFGHSLTVNANISKLNQRYNLSYRYPYFLDTDWELGIDLYRTSRVTTSFDELKNGFDTVFGHSFLFDYTMLYVTYKLEDVTITANGVGNVLPSEGAQNGLTSSVTPMLIRDDRDNRLNARSGSYQAASYEYAGLGGDRFFNKMMFTNRVYFPLPWDMVFKVNTQFGALSPNSSRVVPINERFILGGVSSLRGYKAGTIGSVDAAGFRTGGTQQILFNAEYEIPIVAEVGIRLVTFYDAGAAYDNWSNVWSTNDLDEDRIRQDFGVGIRWFSPLGPLRFEWGIPVDREPGERPVNFEFAIAPSF